MLVITKPDVMTLNNFNKLLFLRSSYTTVHEKCQPKPYPKLPPAPAPAPTVPVPILEAALLPPVLGPLRPVQPEGPEEPPVPLPLEDPAVPPPV